MNNKATPMQVFLWLSRKVENVHQAAETLRPRSFLNCVIKAGTPPANGLRFCSSISARCSSQYSRSAVVRFCDASVSAQELPVTLEHDLRLPCIPLEHCTCCSGWLAVCSLDHHAKTVCRIRNQQVAGYSLRGPSNQESATYTSFSAI